jgi:hypothetical protein
MIDLAAFVQESIRTGIYVGVNPQYLVGVAELRSGITDTANGDEIGPFRLTQAQWNAHCRDSAFDLDFLPNDIHDAHAQISVFARMVRQAFDAFEAANGRTPSAKELYVQQFPHAAAPTLDADLKAAFDTTAQSVAEAEVEVLPSLPEQTLIEQVGFWATAIKARPHLANDITTSDFVALPTKLREGVKELGRAVLIEWAEQLHKLVCGEDPASAKDREKLRHAFGIEHIAGTALLTSGLVGIGCPTVLATVVAAIVMKRFVGSAVDVFCQKSRAWIDGSLRPNHKD